MALLGFFWKSKTRPSRALDGNSLGTLWALRYPFHSITARSFTSDYKTPPIMEEDAGLWWFSVDSQICRIIHCYWSNPSYLIMIPSFDMRLSMSWETKNTYQKSCWLRFKKCYSIKKVIYDSLHSKPWEGSQNSRMTYCAQYQGHCSTLTWMSPTRQLEPFAEPCCRRLSLPYFKI